MKSMWKIVALAATIVVSAPGCILLSTNTCGFSGDPCCSTGTACNSGLTCSASNRCVTTTTQCGGAGQPCCSGNTCTASGAVCDSSGTCNLAPYVGCATASANAGLSCAAGTSASGNIIPTICRRAPITINGTVPNQGFCSAQCTGSGTTQCPAVLNNITDCYLLAGGGGGICAVACPNGAADCPRSTQCVQTQSATGAMINICIQL